MIAERAKHTSSSAFGLSKLEVFDNLLQTHYLTNLHYELLKAGHAKSAYDQINVFDICYCVTCCVKRTVLNKSFCPSFDVIRGTSNSVMMHAAYVRYIRSSTSARPLGDRRDF